MRPGPRRRGLSAAALRLAFAAAGALLPACQPAPDPLPAPPPAGRPAPGLDAYGDPLPPGAVARLGAVRLRHPGGVRAIAFAPDGRTLASAGWDDSVRIWRAQDGREILRLPSHGVTLHALAFDPQHAGAASADEAARRFWTSAGGRRRLFDLTPWDGPRRVPPDGRRVFAAISGVDRLATIDADTGLTLALIDLQEDRLASLAVSPDGRLLAGGGGEGSLRVWDAATGALVNALQAGAATVGALAFSPDGRVLVANTDDGRLRLWETAAWRDRPALPGLDDLPERRWVGDAAFSPDGRRLAAGFGNGAVLVWESPAGFLSGPPGVTLRACLDAHAAGTTAVAFSPDGATLATGGGDGLLRIWDAGSGAPVLAPEGHGGDLESAAFDPRDGTLVTAAGDGTVRRWDGATGREVRSLRLEAPGATLAVSPDAAAAAASFAGMLRVWDVADGRVRLVLTGRATPGETLIVGPGGRAVAVISDSCLSLLDVASGRERALAVDVHLAAFSPDGRRLAACGSPVTLRVWNLAGNRPEETLEPEWEDESAAVYGHHAAFSADGSEVAVATEQGLLRWDAASGRRLPDLAGEARLFAWAPTGRLLAATAWRGAIRLWDGIGRRWIAELDAEASSVVSLAFAPDGRRLAAGLEDGTALVFDVPDAPPTPAPAPPAVAAVDRHGDPLPPGARARLGTVRLRHDGGDDDPVFREGVIAALVYSPDGTTLASITDEGRVRAWDAATGGLLVAAADGNALDRWPQTATFDPGGNLLTSEGWDDSFRLRFRWMPPRRPAARRELVLQSPADFVGTAPEIPDFALSPDGRLLATVHPIPVLWDAATGAPVRSLEDGLTPTPEGRIDRYSRVRFSPDGGALFAIGLPAPQEEEFLLAWDVASGRPRFRARLGAGGDRRVAVSPDGLLVATAGGSLSLWSAADGKRAADLDHPQVRDAAFSPDGKLLASSGHDGAVRIWDVAARREARRIDIGASVGAVAFSPDGRTVATGQEQSIRFWDPATGAELAPREGHHARVMAIAFSPDGTLVASAGSDATVRMWDARTAQERAVLRHKGPAYAVAFSPDGRRLAVGLFDFEDAPLVVWDTQTWEVRRTMRGHANFADAVAFSPDGAFVATAADNMRFGTATDIGDGSVRIWDVESGRQALASDGQGGIAWAAGGRVLAHAGWKAVVFRDTNYPDRLVRFRAADAGDDRAVECAGEAGVLAASRDARWLAAADGGGFLVWEAATARPAAAVRVGDRGDGARRLAFSPDGRWVAAALDRTEGGIGFYELAGGRPLALLETGPFENMALSPDGRTLATAGPGCAALIWDVPPGVTQAPVPAEASEADLERWWGDLAGDPAAAFQAVVRLGLARNAPAFLGGRLLSRPAAVPWAAEFPRRLAALDDDDAAVRAAAAAAIRERAADIEPLLLEAAAAARSAEVRAQLDAILEGVAKEALFPRGEGLRRARAIHALERLGTPEACVVLESAAARAPSRAARRDAASSRERLRRLP